MRYRAFRDELRKHVKQVPVPLRLIFILPMPATWSKRKKAEMNGQPHRQKPDCDNLQKAVLDALLEDDSHVWCIEAAKVWGYDGKIIMTHSNGLDICQ